MSYLFTVTTRPEASLVSALGELASHHHHGATVSFVEPQVYLLKAHGDHYLAATDGTVVRVQRVALFYGSGAHAIAQEKVGPMTHETPLLALLEGWQAQEEPLELERGALKIGERVARKPTRGPRSWEASQVGETAVVSLLRAHVRELPASFESWFFMARPEALARFASTFPEGLEPPVLFLPEAKVDPADPKKGRTWAKYWAFHATTGWPLGAVLGIRSPETLSRFSPKK